MSCNAWNHSSNCSCGWGGDGHLGRGTLFTDLVRTNITFRTCRELQQGFTNPNSKCPVCKCHVFFFSSPFGGRVFFDELGPPWTKHPCTDTGRPVTALPIKISLPSELVVEFEKNGWVPFMCQDIRSVRNYPATSQITGFVRSQKQTFFVVKDGLSKDFPFLIKYGPQQEIWLSTILSTKSEIKADNFRAFEYESDLHELMLNTSSTEVKKKKSITLTHQKKESSKNKVLHSNVFKNKLFKCPQCSSYVRNLKEHTKATHSNQQFTLCPDCGQKVKKIKIHYERMHSQKALDRINKKNAVSLKHRAGNKLSKGNP